MSSPGQPSQQSDDSTPISVGMADMAPVQMHDGDDEVRALQRNPVPQTTELAAKGDTWSLTIDATWGKVILGVGALVAGGFYTVGSAWFTSVTSAAAERDKVMQEKIAESKSDINDLAEDNKELRKLIADFQIEVGERTASVDKRVSANEVALASDSKALESYVARLTKVDDRVDQVCVECATNGQLIQASYQRSSTVPRQNPNSNDPSIRSIEESNTENVM